MVWYFALSSRIFSGSYFLIDKLNNYDGHGRQYILIGVPEFQNTTSLWHLFGGLGTRLLFHDPEHGELGMRLEHILTSFMPKCFFNNNVT